MRRRIIPFFCTGDQLRQSSDADLRTNALAHPRQGFFLIIIVSNE
jgi:hypothetical protein